MHRGLITSFLVVVSLLAGCATMPTGPSVMSLPGTGKSFDQFRLDDFVCRQFAHEQSGGMTGQQAAQDSAVKSAVVGTILGAAAGAAIGSVSGDMGAGAAIGAGSGLILGSAAGSGYSSSSYYESQRRYDHAYLQCMYAKGNRIPVYGRFTSPESSGSTGWESPYPAGYPPPPAPPE
jgi:hypothetical protein